MPQPGFILQDIAQYVPADRPEAASAYGIGTRLGVMAVVAGSPGSRAGLRADDQIEAVNGRELAPGGGDREATTQFADGARRIVADEMRKGSVTLRVYTSGRQHDVSLIAEAGCPSQVALVQGTGVNAWADGERVMLTDAMVAKCATDDDLALVIAHEMAHNILHHRQRLALAGIAGSTLLPTTPVGLAAVRATEEEADQFAVRTVRVAGYGLSQAAAFLGGLLAANGLNDSPASTHPGSSRRLMLLKAAIAAGAGGGKAR